MAVETFKEIQDRTLDLLGKSDTTTRNRVSNWINMGYQDFVLREVWPFREVTGTLNTVAGTQEYDLSTEFSDIDEQNILSVSLQGGAEDKLPYVPFNQLRAEHPDLDSDGSSTPQKYYLKAGSIGFHPQPDAAITVFIDYYKTPMDLSADSDKPIIPKAYREALMHYALSLEHDFNTDPDLAVKAQNRYEQIVTLARNNLLDQPLDDEAFRMRGPTHNKNHTDIGDKVF